MSNWRSGTKRGGMSRFSKHRKQQPRKQQKSNFVEILAAVIKITGRQLLFGSESPTCGCRVPHPSFFEGWDSTSAGILASSFGRPIYLSRRRRPQTSPRKGDRHLDRAAGAPISRVARAPTPAAFDCGQRKHSCFARHPEPPRIVIPNHEGLSSRTK